jgi:hypothetical protein
MLLQIEDFLMVQNGFEKAYAAKRILCVRYRTAAEIHSGESDIFSERGSPQAGSLLLDSPDEK